VSEEEHCKDCCCARSWKALGITEYTGKSIPEHIEELRSKLTRPVVEEDRVVYCVITVQKNWQKPDGCGFIYRNILGVYPDMDRAKDLQDRFMGFTGGEWKKTDRDNEYSRDNTLICIAKIYMDYPQFFDMNH